MYEKQQELVKRVTEQMQVCADMLGSRSPEKETQYGFVPGLNETESENHLRERIRTISQGIFQVMFTGAFSAGKSTLLNALMHTEVLHTGPLPETAVITKIIFSEEDERVVIYQRDKVDQNGQPVTIVMNNIEEFFQEYHVDPNDTEKFLRLVDHVVLYQKGSGIAGSMVQLVDSPGTRASAADDAVALDFAKKADALVFLVNAQQALDKDDKEYIAKHLANRQLKNVFFVVNKINMIVSDEEVEALETYVKEQLRDVFTDTQGTFDEELYRKRVFYVDAFGSMNTRLGRETPVNRRRKEMIPDEETGIPEFEAALGEFLTSGDKDREALKAYRSQMADLYLVAEKSAQTQLDGLKTGKAAVEKKLADFRKEKGRIEAEIRQIAEDIDTTKQTMLRDAKDSYDAYLGAIDTNWEEYFSDKADSMGIHTMQLVGAKARNVLQLWKDKEVRDTEMQEKTKEATREFSEGIQSFLTMKNKEILEDQFGDKIKSRLEELTKKLYNHQENLEHMDIPVDVSQILEMLARDRSISIPGTDKNRANLGQALTGILFGDPELVVAAGGGKQGTIDFLVDIIKTNVLDMVITYILFAVVGNIWALVTFIIVKIAKANVRGESITEKMIAETKNMLLNGEETSEDGEPALCLSKEGKALFISKTETVLGGAMSRASYELTEGIRKRLETIEQQLADVLAELSINEHAYEDECVRMEAVLNTIRGAISRMNELTEGTPLTEEGIKALATGTED